MNLNLTRRKTLQTLAASATLGAFAGSKAFADELSNLQAYTRFAKNNPWALGWRSAPAADLTTPKMQLVSGKMPTDLSGTFYRNGPALFERGGLRLNHWFDGDGMVHAYHIADGNISHTGRMVRTEKYLQEQKAGRYLVPAFGTNIKSQTAVTGPDSLNVANTSVMPLNGEVLALWEGGSAYRLDDSSLETLGVKTWAAELKGMPFSAHPKIEQNGTIWNFGQDPFANRLIVYKIAANGKLAGMHLLRDVPGGMIHDFCMTKKHLIFVAPSFRITNSGATIFDRYQWMPSESQRVVVVEKDNLDNRYDYELPPGFQFHFGNAWEDKQGNIRFTACMSDSEFVEKGTKALMRGQYIKVKHAALSHIVLRKNGTAEIEKTSHQRIVHEFPQFNAQMSGLNARYLYTVGDAYDNAPGQTSVLKHDLKSGKITAHNYGAQSISEEHLFIQRPGCLGEDDGWLIGTSLNLKTKATRLNILSAKHLEDDPIAVFELPYAVPLGFHGAWKS